MRPSIATFLAVSVHLWQQCAPKVPRDLAALAPLWSLGYEPYDERLSYRIVSFVPARGEATSWFLKRWVAYVGGIPGEVAYGRHVEVRTGGHAS